MKTICSRLILAVALLVAVAGPLHAQTTLTSTSLSAAITDPAATRMTINSATGWTASTSASQTYALIEREAVLIRAINGTAITITRGLVGTRATGHPTGSVVYYIPAGSATLSTYDRTGSCSTTGSTDMTQDASNLPILVPASGRLYSCVASNWAFADITTRGGYLTYPVNSGGLAAVYACGGLSGNSTCTNQQTSYTGHMFGGTVTLSAGAAIISGINPTFTTTSTGFCTAIDNTAASGATVKAVVTGVSSITLSGGVLNDSVSYFCWGY